MSLLKTKMKFVNITTEQFLQFWADFKMFGLVEDVIQIFREIHRTFAIVNETWVHFRTSETKE